MTLMRHIVEPPFPYTHYAHEYAGPADTHVSRSFIRIVELMRFTLVFLSTNADITTHHARMVPGNFRINVPALSLLRVHDIAGCVTSTISLCRSHWHSAPRLCL